MKLLIGARAGLGTMVVTGITLLFVLAMPNPLVYKHTIRILERKL